METTVLQNNLASNATTPPVTAVITNASNGKEAKIDPVEIEKLTPTQQVAAQKNVDEQNKDQDALKKQLEEIVNNLNKEMSPMNTDLKFGFHEDSKTFYVSVIDKKTDKVIRKFPTDEALQLMMKMREVIGQIFDTKG